MIKYLTKDTIDYPQWDACVAASFNEAIYGYSWFLDAIAPQWAGLVLGDYEAVFPVIYNTKFGVHYLCQTSFLQHTGIFAKAPLETEQRAKLFAALPKKFVKWDFCTDAHSLPPEGRVHFTKKRNLVLQLNAPYADLLNGCHKNTRRNIKQAESAELEIRTNTRPHQVIETYKANAAQKEGFALPPKDYAAMLKLMEHCVANKRGQIVSAYKENLLVGAVFFAFSATRMYYLFSANTILGKETKALFAIVNNVMQRHAGSPMLLDFEGSMHAGVARFYGGFGAREEIYYNVQRKILDSFFTLYPKQRNAIS